METPNPARRMTRADLLGGHTHQTLCGKRVHVYRRDGTYIARGRLRGRAFGESLGADPHRAAARLRQVLTEIEAGAYHRPSEGRTRPLAPCLAPRLTFRQLADEFLSAKRTLRGAATAADYSARLVPILTFADLPANRARWPLAADIDAAFAAEARAFLHVCRSTRNGRPGGQPRPLSPRQVVNVMETLRGVLAWAADPRNRRLPAGWVNPLTPDLVGTPPAKDPLRPDPLPLPDRVRLVEAADRWRLCQLALSFVLPLRPDEAAGLLVDDVDFDRGQLLFGANLPGVNFTKRKVSYRLPFPDELRPVLRACVGGRGGGPLLRTRRAFAGRSGQAVNSLTEMQELFDRRLAAARPGVVQTDHDRKVLFRRLLRELGGVSPDGLNREFKSLAAAAGVGRAATLYTLRSAVTTGMSVGAKLAHLELTYLTGHRVSDILAAYTGLDVHGEMRKYFAHARPLLDAIARRAVGPGRS